jgi:hypothetical protein
VLFKGFPLSNAKEQSGAIAIAQAGNLFITGIPGQGLRQIDPRTELPLDLRVRPSTFLAYQFIDQPFELDLRIDPSPPLVSTDARTTVSLEGKLAEIDTWIKSEPAHGRLFDLHVTLPRGLELKSVGPRESVESWQIATEADGSRTLTVRLTTKVHSGSPLEVHVVGRQAIDPSRSVDVALFRPRESASGGGRVVVLADRNLTVDLADGESSQSSAGEVFRPARQEPPADWPWPPGRPGFGTPARWLRHDGNPVALPLRIVVHPRTVALESNLLVELGRNALEVRQDTECAVHFGTLDHLDVEVPVALEGRWNLEDADVAQPVDLGATRSGSRLVRLKFAEEISGKHSLALRYRLPFASPIGPGGTSPLEIRWFQFRDVTASPPRVRVASEPGVRVAVQPQSWVSTEADDLAASDDPQFVSRFTLTPPKDRAAPTSLTLNANAYAVTSLPPLVASRVWLRTTQGPDRELRTTAAYRIETHGSTFAVALPPGARWEQARVGGEPIGQVETLPRGGGYRFRFPARTGAGDVRVELEYTSASAAGSAWRAPRLLEGGEVQQTLWEVRIPGNRALVGIPGGWVDMNTWYWDQYRWRRRPVRSPASLAAWIGAGSSQRRMLDDGEEDGRTGYHSFLFERPGSPVDIRPRIATAAEILALCSGSALALGVPMLYLHPRFRLLAMLLIALGVAVAAAVNFSVTLLTVQSAALGIVFTLVAAFVKGLVDRPRRAASAIFGEPGALPSGSTPGSSVSRPALVGSDDSTAIRVRPSSTVDQHPTAAPAGSETPSGRTTSRGG